MLLNLKIFFKFQMQKKVTKVLFGALDLPAFQENKILIIMTLLKLVIYILRFTILQFLMLGPLMTKLSGLIGHHTFRLCNFLLYTFQLYNPIKLQLEDALIVFAMWICKQSIRKTKLKWFLVLDVLIKAYRCALLQILIEKIIKLL